jgi:hypothetical protein
VLAAEHLLGLAGVDERRQFVERAAEVVADRLAGFGPLDEDVEIVEAAPQRLAQVAIFLEPAAALEDFLGAGLILPEVRSGNAFFDFREFVLGAGGVKDGSAGRWRGAPDPRACEAVLPVAMRDSCRSRAAQRA